MSTFALGAGFESFQHLMDVEAEATVSVKSGGSEAPAPVEEPAEVVEETAPETPDTVEQVEDNAATEEKQDEDIESSENEMNQTMKAIDFMKNTAYTMSGAAVIMKKYGSSAGLLEYLNLTSNFEARIRKISGKQIVSVEAFTGSDIQTKALISAAENIAANAWESIKKFALKLKDIITSIYNKIIERFHYLSVAINNVHKKVSSLKIDTVSYENKHISVPTKESLMTSLKMIAELKGPLMQGYDEACDAIIKIKDDKFKLDITNISEIDDYTSKQSVIECLEMGSSSVSIYMELEKYLKQVEEKLVNIAKDAETGNDQQLEADKTSLEVIKSCVSTIANSLWQRINFTLRIGNSFIDAATKTAQSDAVPTGESLTNALDMLNFDKFAIGSEAWYDQIVNGFKNLFKKMETRYENLKNIDYAAVAKCDASAIANESAYGLPKSNFMNIMKLYTSGFNIKKLSSDLDAYMKADDAGKKNIVGQYVQFAGEIAKISDSKLDEVWAGKAEIKKQFTNGKYSKFDYTPADMKACVSSMMNVVNIYRTNLKAVEGAASKALGWGTILIKILIPGGLASLRKAMRDWALKKFKNVTTDNIEDMERMCIIVGSYFSIAKLLVDDMIPFFEVYCKRCMKTSGAEAPVGNPAEQPA